jgi:hypothetical protein
MSSGSFGNRMFPVAALSVSENQLPKQSPWKQNSVLTTREGGGGGGGPGQISGARLFERGSEAQSPLHKPAPLPFLGSTITYRLCKLNLSIGAQITVHLSLSDLVYKVFSPSSLA